VYDYNNILDSASVEKKSADELFSLYKNSGVTSLAVYDETAGKLMDNGFLLVYRGSDFMLSAPGNSDIRADHIYMQKADVKNGDAYFAEAKRNLGIYMPKDSFRVLDVNGKETLEVNASWERFIDMPIGVFKTSVKDAADRGFYVVLRPKNPPHVTKEEIDLFFETVDSCDKVSAVLFHGKEALGYSDLLDYTTEQLKKRKIPLVLIEAQNQLGFERQDGSVDMAKALDYNCVRLYAMSKEELIKLDAKEAASRFYISTIERNIRMDLFPSYKFALNGVSLSEVNAAYIADVAQRLEDHGFTIGKASVMEPYFPNPLLRALAAVGAVSLCVIVLGMLFPFLTKFLWLFEIAGIALTAGLFLLRGSLLPMQLLALGSAVCTPVCVVGLFLDYCVRKKEEATENVGWLHILIESAVLLWGMGFVCLIGACFVSAILGDITFFLEMNIYRGVKLTFVLPLILISIYYIQRFPFFGKVVASDTDFVAFVKKFCKMEIHLGLLAVLGVIGMAGIMFIGRSGNNGAPVPQFEVAFRRFLESIMYARPREKEFLFGHPAVLVSLVALYRKWPQVLHYFLIIAVTIGMGSMVETFAHMRSPFFLSFVRGLDGLALGTLSLIAAWLGCIILTKITKFFGERYGQE